MKKWYYWIIGILLLLIITNPSVNAFKTYLGYTSYSGLRRTANMFVCSIYTDKRYASTNSYFAVLGNFWALPKPMPKHSAQQSDSDTSKKADTTMAKMADTTKVDEYGIPIRRNSNSDSLPDMPPPPRKKIVGYTKDGLPIYKYQKDPLHILTPPPKGAIPVKK